MIHSRMQETIKCLFVLVADDVERDFSFTMVGGTARGSTSSTVGLPSSFRVTQCVLNLPDWLQAGSGLSQLNECSIMERDSSNT